MLSFVAVFRVDSGVLGLRFTLRRSVADAQRLPNQCSVVNLSRGYAHRCVPAVGLVALARHWDCLRLHVAFALPSIARIRCAVVWKVACVRPDVCPGQGLCVFVCRSRTLDIQARCALV